VHADLTVSAVGFDEHVLRYVQIHITPTSSLDSRRVVMLIVYILLSDETLKPASKLR
jgi:hypothetical protein